MEEKELGKLTAEDIKKLGEQDPIIYACLNAFDITTQSGWENALISALYFKSEACRVLSEAFLEYKQRGPAPIIIVKEKEE